MLDYSKKIAYLLVGTVTVTEEPGEKLPPTAAITTPLASAPVTSPSTRIINGHHLAEPIQTNGGKKETASDRPPSAKVAPWSPSSAPELDGMDIDVQPEPSIPAAVVAREDVEMGSGNASEVDQDSSSEELDEDEKELTDYEESSSDEEDEDEDEGMPDTPDNKPENPAGDTIRSPTILGMPRTKTTPAVLEPRPEETNNLKTAPTEPEKYIAITTKTIDKV